MIDQNLPESQNHHCSRGRVEPLCFLCQQGFFSLIDRDNLTNEVIWWSKSAQRYADISRESELYSATVYQAKSRRRRRPEKELQSPRRPRTQGEFAETASGRRCLGHSSLTWCSASPGSVTIGRCRPPGLQRFCKDSAFSLWTSPTRN